MQPEPVENDKCFALAQRLHEIRRDWDACGDAPWDMDKLIRVVGLEPKAARLAAGLHNAFPDLERQVIDLIGEHRRLKGRLTLLEKKLESSKTKEKVEK